MDRLANGPAGRTANPTDPLARKSAIVKRSVELNGHKTSVSLEDEFWDGLRGIAERSGVALPALLQTIDAARGHSNLSSAIRVYVLEYHRATAPRRFDAHQAAAAL